MPRKPWGSPGAPFGPLWRHWTGPFDGLPWQMTTSPACDGVSGQYTIHMHTFKLAFLRGCCGDVLSKTFKQYKKVKIGTIPKNKNKHNFDFDQMTEIFLPSLLAIILENIDPNYNKLYFFELISKKMFTMMV